MELQIISTKVIKPSKPTPLHLKCYRLSFINQLTAFGFPGTTFFFLPEGEAKINEFDKRCDRLEKSLSETLTRYYPVAGRYHRDDFLVDCSDQGVQVSRARVDGNLREIIHGRRGMELLHSFAPNPIAMAEMVPCPIFSVQISMFNCGGIAIGTRIMHNMCDGFCFVTFMKEWAEMNRQGGIKRLDDSPSFELSSLFPARDLAGLKPTSPPRTMVTENKLVTMNFLFDSDMISALKAEATSPSSGKRSKLECEPSKVQVVTAHLWRILIRVSEAKHRKMRPSLLTSSVNLRPRLPLQIPKNPFGTLVGKTTAHFIANEEAEDKMELDDLVGLLRNSLKKTEEGFAKAKDIDGVYATLLRSFNEMVPDKPEDVDDWLVSSWCRFPCYELDFGWGKLSWMACLPRKCGLILLLDAPPHCGRNAIEAWVNLKEDDMIEFQRLYQDYCCSNHPTSFSRGKLNCRL